MNHVIVIGVLGSATFILFMLSVYALSNDVELIAWARAQLDLLLRHKEDTTGYAEEPYSSRD